MDLGPSRRFGLAEARESLGGEVKSGRDWVDG